MSNQGPKVALFRQAGIGIAMAEDRRREMDGKLDIAFELLLEPLCERAIGVKPRDLILVLDRHQLVQIARHGLREDLAFRRDGSLRGAHFVDKAR